MKKIIIYFLCSIFSVGAFAYPIDGYTLTGIARLLYLQYLQDGTLKGKIEPVGKLKTLDEIHLNLYGREVADELPAIDPELQSALEDIVPDRYANYSMTVMDISPCADKISYAAIKEDKGYQPGSVGKLAVITGLFKELSRIYPTSFQDRQTVLREKRVRAMDWAMSDEHTVPIFDVDKKRLIKRTVIPSDVFSVYEWADHMMSVSNNGAASVVWREAMLMRQFGECYRDLTEDEADLFFKEADRKALTELAMSVVNDPLRELGISDDEWRLGSLFTQGGKKRVSGYGGSTGTPEGLMKWMYALEKGDIVDWKTSLEIKRLMYITDRRIRYASTKVLDEAAVYFKSGSFYKCDRSKNANCGKYQGNVYNYMNSVAIVEQPDGTTYMVALMTNVLGKNSNGDHQNLAKRIDDLLRERKEAG